MDIIWLFPISFSIIVFLIVIAVHLRVRHCIRRRLTKKYYLIAYSMTSSNNRVVNDLSNDTPAKWLLYMNKEYQDEIVILHFAIEITSKEYDQLSDII